MTGKLGSFATVLHSRCSDHKLPLVNAISTRSTRPFVFTGSDSHLPHCHWSPLILFSRWLSIALLDTCYFIFVRPGFLYMPNLQSHWLNQPSCVTASPTYIQTGALNKTVVTAKCLKTERTLGTHQRSSSHSGSCHV